MKPPLEVRPAFSMCRTGPTGLWRQVGQCLSADVPVVSVRQAELQVFRSGSSWSVRIGLVAADRDKLGRWSAAHVGQQIVYVVPRLQDGGRDANPATVTTVRGRTTTIEIPVLDAGDAVALISRFRS
jgi:hypothetical protein